MPENKPKYYKTVVKIEILSDYPYDPGSIDEIAHDIVDGECREFSMITELPASPGLYLENRVK